MASASSGSATPAGGTLRPRSGVVVLVTSAVVGLGLLADAALRAGAVEMLRLAPWVLLAVWAVYVSLYASHIAYDADGVLVQNYLRRTRVPWSRVSEIDMRWQVRFALADGSSLVAYGGPVAPRPGPTGTRAREAGDSLPAWMRDLSTLRGAWHHADGSRSDAEKSGDIARTWDLPAVVIGAASAAACVALSVV